MRRTMDCWSIALGALVAVACGGGGAGGDDGDAGGDDGDAGIDASDGDDLAHACERAAQPGARLRVTGYQHGGERWSRGWHDTARDEECRMMRATDGSWRCLPARGGHLVYLDASCTQPAARPDEPPGPANAAVMIDASCPPQYEVRALGAAGDVAAYQRYADGSCRSIGTVEGYHPLGAAVPPSDFVGFTSVRLGDGAVQQVVAVGEDGSRWCEGLVDRAGGMCAPKVAADGALRCWPGGADVLANDFVDAECTRPAGRVVTTCAPTGAVAYDEAGAVERVFSIIGPAATVYEGDAVAGSCTPHPRRDGPFVEIGAEIDAASVPTLTADVAPGSGRLRPRIVVDGAGVRMRHGPPWDTALEAPCDFEIDLDGQIRCIPTDTWQLTMRFLDPECTQRVGLVWSIWSVPRYGREPRQAHDVAPRLARMGGMIAGPFYEDSGGTCRQVTHDPPVGWRTTGPLALSELATATPYP
jgi:hypothetical protein